MSKGKAMAGKRRTIAEVAAEVLREKGRADIWFGEPDLWHEIYDRAKGEPKHPLEVWGAVLSALRKSKLFYRSCYIRAVNATGSREILHPVYALKDN